MKYLAIAPSEFRSNRFETFVEHLGMDESAEGLKTAAGYLMTWYCRWAEDPEFDHGLLFGIREKRLGSWSEHPNPSSFSKALLAAGYVAKLKDFYGRDEDGYVVLNGDGGVSLDVSWDGWHRKSPIAYRLAHYLTDPERRLYWVAKFNDEGLGMAVASDGAAGDDNRAGGSGRLPERFRRESGAGSARSASPPPEDVLTSKKDVKEGDKKTSDVATPTGPAHGERPRTGNRKTTAMRDYIRENKYDDTIGCLCQLDSTPPAVEMWKEICRRDIGFAHMLLAEMTETDEKWSGIHNPAATAVKPILKRLRLLRRQTRTEGHP